MTHDALMSLTEYISIRQEEFRLFRNWCEEHDLNVDGYEEGVTVETWDDRWETFCNSEGLVEGDPIENARSSSVDNLDDTPLTFGKFKGKTPKYVVRNYSEGNDYIIWLYENVKNKPTCSWELYYEAGGRNPNPDTGKAKVIAPPVRPSAGFDNYDDDIPF